MLEPTRADAEAAFVGGEVVDGCPMAAEGTRDTAPADVLDEGAGVGVDEQGVIVGAGQLQQHLVGNPMAEEPGGRPGERAGLERLHRGVLGVALPRTFDAHPLHRIL
ncbi:MAG: hypothetical protein M5U19_06715 [Microthrixaceae bacterium]|nr:hypothetical protein [Microthrixaceae bacterium]